MRNARSCWQRIRRDVLPLESLCRDVRRVRRAAYFIIVIAFGISAAANGAEGQTVQTNQTAQGTQTNQPPSTNQADLTELPIEQLMNIEITSVSKKSEKLSESAAAIFVLTQDDIKRSGAMSIPEALRLVPGLDVAQVDSQQWAISARGFNDIFADKLLVMQDGRSLYTPLFSGVFWDVQNTPIDDIDRIEVIRGPGASLWGDNAVNGVINIITKSAKDTQGWLVTGGGGSYEDGFGMVRYGGVLGDNVYYRIYGQYFDRGDSEARDGGDAHDSWQMGQGGFRVDWDTTEQNQMTFQGDFYGGGLGQKFGVFDPANPPTLMEDLVDDVHVNGENVLGRWTHWFSDSSQLKLQTYFDRTDRDTAIFSEKLETYDVDLQHEIAIGERNDFIWGLGYRLYEDNVGNTPTVSLNPDIRSSQLFSGFAQDEITLIEKRLKLTLGARVEHNDYTGFDFQPNARLAWTPDDKQTVWSAASRAVRSPSEAEESITLTQVIPPNALAPGSPAVPATILGNSSFESEVLYAYELGYRVRPCSAVSLDVAGYFNHYEHLRSEEFGAGLPVPIVLENLLDGQTYGVEPSATWQVCDWWRLRPAYTLLKMHLNKDTGSTDPISVSTIEGESPQQQFSLRSSMDLPQNISFDWTVRYVDRLPAFNINSYVAMDVRIAWRPVKRLELAIVGQNLGGRHAEFNPTFISTQQTDVRPSGYGKVTWHF